METENTKIDILIARYLDALATDEEISFIENWYEQSEENREHFRKIRFLFESAKKLPLSPERALEKVINRIGKQRSLQQIIQRVAAILFIPILLSVVLFNIISKNKHTPEFHTAEAAFGSVSSIVLPDGSKVWINSGSKLKYPETFKKGERIVFLTGEAYFEVHSDKSQPFIVITDKIKVVATGTHFNVMAYPGLEFVSVSLAEGKVSVENTGNSPNNQMIRNMIPDQHLRYDISTGEVIVQNDEVYKQIAWKDGKLVFRNDPISEVARKISLQYNIEIEIKGEKIKSYRFRATFENEPLDEILKILKLSSPIDYREIAPQINADSSVTKRKIIIFSTES